MKSKGVCVVRVGSGRGGLWARVFGSLLGPLQKLNFFPFRSPQTAEPLSTAAKAAEMISDQFTTTFEPHGDWTTMVKQFSSQSQFSREHEALLLMCGIKEGLPQLTSYSVSEMTVQSEVVGPTTFRKWLSRSNRHDVDDKETTVDFIYQIAVAMHKLHGLGMVWNAVDLSNVLVEATKGVSLVNFHQCCIQKRREDEPMHWSSDVFQFGELMFEAFSNRRAYPENATENLLQHFLPRLDSVPRRFRNLIIDCLALAPKSRPSMKSLIAQMSSAPIADKVDFDELSVPESPLNTTVDFEQY